MLDKLIPDLNEQILRDIQRAPLVVYALLWKSFPDAEWLSAHKNQLLKILISDCKLNGKVLEYKVKVPFDKLIQCNDYKQISNVVIEHLDEFEGVKV